MFAYYEETFIPSHWTRCVQRLEDLPENIKTGEQNWSEILRKLDGFTTIVKAHTNEKNT